MHVRRRRHQPTPTLSLDNAALGRTLGETHRKHRLITIVGINPKAVRSFQGDLHSVEIEFAAGEIAHAALGAPLMINLEGWSRSVFCPRHTLLLFPNHLSARGLSAPQRLAAAQGPHHSAPARTCCSPVWLCHRPS